MRRAAYIRADAFRAKNLLTGRFKVCVCVSIRDEESYRFRVSVVIFLLYQPWARYRLMMKARTTKVLAAFSFRRARFLARAFQGESPFMFVL